MGCAMRPIRMGGEMMVLDSHFVECALFTSTFGGEVALAREEVRL